MHTLQLLLVAALGVSIIATLLMRMPGAKRGHARKLLADAEWLDDNTADGTYVKVRGTARAMGGERLLSPLTKNRCVALRLRAAVRNGRDPRSKLVESVQVIPFEIEDEDGKIVVESTAVVLDVVGYRSSKWKPEDKRVILIELGHPTANADASHVEETLVEVGQTVTVAGTLKKTDSEPTLRLVGNAERPISIAIERARDRDLSAEP